MTAQLNAPLEAATLPETAPRVEVDVITAEVIRSALVAITDEMKTNLRRTAYNPVIYEALDFTVGLFDAEGNVVSIGLGLPMFIRGISDVIKAEIAFYGFDGIEPGDVLLTNDAYITGSHLYHMTFTLPIFHDGRIIAWAGAMAHWLDVGGTLPGTTRDIYSEGLQMPIVKIFKRGVQDPELTAIIRNNVRFADLAMGDFRAEMASVRTGERRFKELVERYGSAAVLGSIERIFDQSERLARAAVATIPDGVYEAEAFMDDDGVVEGKPIPIKVRVTVAGEEMTIDLSEVSRQVAGYFNSGPTAGRSAAQVAFKCLTSPTLFPINEGSFRPLKIILPEGRVVSATKPAAMRRWMVIPMTIVDCIFKAVAEAVPERAIAGHHADLLYARAYGVDQRNGRFFVAHVGITGGGWGAKHNEDGVCTTICINDGDTHAYPNEAMEVKYPVIIESYGLRTDSGGAGRHRGGLGGRRVVRMTQPTTLSTQVERTLCPPWGILGGLPGLANRPYVRRADGSEIRPTNGKMDSVPLNAGDRYVIESGGGGGFGDPLERPAEKVLEDVRLGYVSREAAERDYKVVIRPDRPEIDLAATEALRAQARKRAD